MDRQECISRTIAAIRADDGMLSHLGADRYHDAISRISMTVTGIVPDAVIAEAVYDEIEAEVRARAAAAEQADRDTRDARNAAYDRVEEATHY